MDLPAFLRVLGASSSTSTHSSAQTLLVPPPLLPEQGLQVLRQLCASGVARIHGDEDAHGGDEAYYLAQEVKHLFLGPNCILDTLYLDSWYADTHRHGTACVCKCVYACVLVYTYVQNSNGCPLLLLCTSLFLRQGLLLNVELTSRLDCLPERPWAPPTPCMALLLILFMF